MEGMQLAQCIMRSNVVKIAVAAVLLATGIAASQATSPDRVLLTEKNWFPKDGSNVFLAYPTDIDVSGERVYVCDYQANTIYVFDRSGDLARKIGRFGQGPGEFQGPGSVDVEGERMIVKEQTGTLNVLSRDGAYQNAFKPITTLASAAVWHDTLYAVTASLRADALLGDDGLISLFSLEGERIRSFGRYLELAPDLTTAASSGYVQVHEGDAYYVSAFYPILRIYDKGGQLKNEVSLRGRDYRSRVEENYRFENYKKGKAPYRIARLFDTVEVNERGIFLGLTGDNVLIDHYDLNGRYLTSYYRELEGEGARFIDLDVGPKDRGAPTFYTLVQDSLPKVSVLTAQPLDADETPER